LTLPVMRIVLFPACNADWTVAASRAGSLCDSKPPTRDALRDYASASAKALQMSFEAQKKDRESLRGLDCASGERPANAGLS